MSSRSVVFTIPAGTAAAYFLFPGGLEAPAGVYLASGTIESITVRSDTSAILTTEIFDCHDTVGAPMGSTNRGRYEVDVTAVNGLMNVTPNRFECFGTAIVNLTLGNHNRKAAVKTVANSGSETTELQALCRLGMIVRVTPSGALGVDCSVTISYRPIELGSYRKKLQAQGFFARTS